MSELTDYDIRHINESINKIQSAFSAISKKIGQSNIHSDCGVLESRLSSYIKEAQASQRSLERSIKTAIEGSRGFFSSKDGVNDLINKQITKLNDNLNNLSEEFSKSVEAIIGSISTVSKPDLIAITADFDNILSKDTELNGFEDEDASLVPLNAENVEEPEEDEDAVLSDSDIVAEDKEKDSSASEDGGLISDIGAVLATQLPEKEEESKKAKRVVIKKNTPLDNDDIKKLFISRKGRYGLNLEQLNYGIEFAGNNVDKNKILLGAMYKKYTDDLNKGDYFFLLNDSHLIREFLDDDPKQALEFLFGDFLLFCSGYSSAHAHAPWRCDFSKVYIDPRMLSSKLVELNEKLNLSKGDLKKCFVESKPVHEIFSKLEKPFFDIETSSEIMLKAYESPNDFLDCSKLGFRRIN